MNSLCNILLFLVWPFGGFLYTLFRPYNKITYLIFASFFFMIGCSFSFSDETVDSYRYAEEFVKTSGYDFITGLLYHTVILDRIDIYYGMVSLLLGSITDNPHMLYGFFGAIYGIFVCKLFIIFKQDWKAPFNVYVWILCALVFAFNPHSNINGVRFWTATWLYCVSLIAYVGYGEKRWLTGILLTPIVHSSFINYVGLFFASHYFKKSYHSLLIISIMVSILNAFGIEEGLISLVPRNLSYFSHYEAYLDLSYMDERAAEQASRHFIHKLLPIYMSIVYITFLWKVRKIKYELGNQIHILLTTSMVFYIFNTLFSFIPSMARFNVVVMTIFIYLVYKYYAYYRNYVFSSFILLLVPPLIIYIYNAYWIHKAVLDPVYLTGTIDEIFEFALF